jgi:chemotaxis protein CheD
MQNAEGKFASEENLLKKITIGIGELHAESEPAVITTVLGSCVSVCLFDPLKRIGGMNHILLPGNADLKLFNVSARYGVNAMELLINKMLTKGADRARLRAKVFGGGRMLTDTPQVYSPGKENARFVFDFLDTEGIQVDSFNVGGAYGRKIHFYTHSGEVLMKRIKALSVMNIRRREEKFNEKLQKEVPKSGWASLF